MQLSVFDSAKSSSATVHSLSFDELVEKLKSPEILDEPPDPKRAKEIKVTQAQGWSGALFTNNTRAKKNVQSICLLTYDLDGPRGEGIEKPSGFPYKYVLHTTTSSGFCEAPKGKYRLIFPLARPISATEYEVLWEKTRRELKLVVDEACKDASRIYFEPIIFREHAGRYVCEEGKGPLLGATFSKSLVTKRHDEKYWLEKIALAGGKYEAVKEGAFAIACLRIRAGGTTDDVKELVFEALRENERRQSSGPVDSWYDAERQIEGCIQRAREEIEAEEADPLRKNSPSPAPALQKSANRELRSACKDVKNGGDLSQAAFAVGRFVPHALDEETARRELEDAWKQAKNSPHDAGDASSVIETGLGAGMAKPVGIWDNWRRMLRTTADGKGHAPTNTNVQILVNNHPELDGLVRYDIRRGETVLTRDPPWEGTAGVLKDEDENLIGPWVANELQVPGINSEVAFTSLLNIAKLNSFDCFMEYLESIPKENGTELLDRVLIDACGAADTQYVRLAARYWFTSVYARQIRPGDKVDSALILSTGEQGRKKSSFFRDLFPVEIQKACFSDQIPDWHDKDVHFALERFAVVELAELSQMNKKTVEQIKAFLSSSSAHVRAAYGRQIRNVHRRTVFAGTTNETSDYLQDHTGNRRFWPVEIKKTDLDWLSKNRDKIWSQARFYYETTRRWWPTDDELSLFREAQDAVTALEPIHESVENLINKTDSNIWTRTKEKFKIQLLEGQGETGKPLKFVTIPQIIEYLVNQTAFGKFANPNAVRRVLQKMQWIPEYPYISGVRTRIWKRPS